MKKWISFIMILFLAFIFVGCGEEKDPTPDDGKDTIKVTDMTVSGIVDGQEMEVGDELELEIKVIPENATNKNVRVTIVDTSVLKVEDNKKITALKAGETTVSVTPLGNTSLKKDYKVKVNGEVAVVEPTSIEIISQNGNEVKASKTLSLTVNAEPNGASKSVIWSSSDESIAKVNNGIVIGIAEGEATITAISKLNENIKADFKVKVIPFIYIDPIVIQPESITIDLSDDEVEVGYKITAKATVLPNGADQNVIWEIKDPDIATVDENGKITGVSAGTTRITVYSKVDSSVKISKKVKVTPSTDPDVYPDLKGYTIVIMNSEAALSDLDPFLDDYTGQDKMFKQKAWNEVEKLYNCKISVEAYPTDAAWGTQRIQWINSQAEQGDAKADFYTISTAWMPDIASVGSAHDAKIYYAKYGKNQMDLVLKQASTFRGGLYGLSTAADEAKNYTDLGLYYNLGWVEKLKLESPAKLFNEGKWNYSTFVKWVNDCQALLDDGQYALAGHYYYYWLGMTNAAGVKIANTTSVNATLKHSRSKAVVEMLKGFIATGALATTSTWMEQSGEFFDSEAVMTTGSWWFLKTDNRWRTDMWGEDTRFGYVPFPYPDDMTKEQTRIASYGTTMILFAAGRDNVHPADVSYEVVYQAMLDYYLKAARYYSEDPSYDPETLKRNAISAKVDDPESVEAAMWWNNSNCMYDAAHDFYTSIATSPIRATIISIINSGKDYDQAMDELEGTYLNKFYETYSS